jgi:hypothetical protein
VVSLFTFLGVGLYVHVIFVGVFFSSCGGPADFLGDTMIHVSGTYNGREGKPL